jgi:hypothetical protein
MSETIAPEVAEKPARAIKPRVVRERYEVRLLNSKGTELLRWTAEQAKRGGFRSFGVHHVIVEGKRKPGKGRGATAQHTEFAEATKAVDKAVAKAVELGWVKQVKKVGGPRPDAFDLKSIPTPGK